MLVFQIKTIERNSEESGWYDTDEGNLFYFAKDQIWSCREDQVSEEYPSLWYEPFNKHKNNIGLIGGISIEDIKHVVEVIGKFYEQGKTVIMVGNNQEYAENIPLRPRLEDIETLLIKSMPDIYPITFIKEKRTNHERQPSRFGRRK